MKNYEKLLYTLVLNIIQHICLVTRADGMLFFRTLTYFLVPESFTNTFNF